MPFPLRLVPQHTSINFVSKRYYALAFSIAIMLLTLILFVSRGLNLGIDFTGGTLIEASIHNTITIDDIRSKVTKLNSKTVLHLLDNSDNDYRKIAIYTPLHGKFNADSNNTFTKNLGYDAELLKNSLVDDFHDNISFHKIEYVGPKVGKHFVLNSLLALSIALCAMMLYTWSRFNWQFSVGVLLSLLHDTVATIGFYMIMGYEFDLTSIAALLTVIGYSINDTVVIYDRIRENVSKYPKRGLLPVINMSINDTLSRTVMTLATTLLVCLIITFCGGSTLHNFGAAISFGVIFGAYSSVYISTAILLLFKR